MSFTYISRPLANIKVHKIETLTKTTGHAIRLRRHWYKHNTGISTISRIPFKDPIVTHNHLNTLKVIGPFSDTRLGLQPQKPTLPFYDQVYKRNCDNCIGYIPIPVGIAGPIPINSKVYHVPLATTEGALIAGINRAAKWISSGSQDGIACHVEDIGITRAPVVTFENIVDVNHFVEQIRTPLYFINFKKWFGETTNHGNLVEATPYVVGLDVHIRFRALSGDCMGMNMISKGVDHIMSKCLRLFPKMRLVSLSGNMCTDKKNSAINWIHGRGKRVNAVVQFPIEIIPSLMGCTAEALVEISTTKNLVGSAMVGSIGGFNAQLQVKI
jgi:hydroxymethylglutaryl-CoA reductase (NADPH)